MIFNTFNINTSSSSFIQIMTPHLQTTDASAILKYLICLSFRYAAAYNVILIAFLASLLYVCKCNRTTFNQNIAQMDLLVRCPSLPATKPCNFMHTHLLQQCCTHYQSRLAAVAAMQVKSGLALDFVTHTYTQAPYYGQSFQ